ncbi:hypothetical protein [Brevibacterium aurantiacum]|uniref:hypothetical protein n=1 Tax=Brevibacterium aurantiacum TaxID=273384 RepID=UPI001F0AB2F5|nr:hypothetical protein [Brevibacterium aurantiacum]
MWQQFLHEGVEGDEALFVALAEYAEFLGGKHDVVGVGSRDLTGSHSLEFAEEDHQYVDGACCSVEGSLNVISRARVRDSDAVAHAGELARRVLLDLADRFGPFVKHTEGRAGRSFCGDCWANVFGKPSVEIFEGESEDRTVLGGVLSPCHEPLEIVAA